MKYRFLLLTTISLLTLTSTWAANDKKKNVLSLKESITDNAIVYPSSFESNTKDMMESWYLKDFTFDKSAINNSNYGTVSDKVYKERLQKLPTVIEMPFNQIVRSYIERYVVKGRTLVAQLVGMSSYYMPIFEAALERHQMPLELKYIPIIESALNPNAVSPAGAGGLWQFMPSTAKGNGLEVNSQVDERRDPYMSSEKAAVFFKKLYDTYGDWSLAIAAYNCGPGNVNKAIKRAGTEHPDFWEIYNYLPKETRGYVPAFIAANYVMTYYREHGINPTRPNKPLIIDTVQVNKKVSFNQISQVLNIPLDEIRILNPQYRTDVIPGNVHPYTLALPSQQIYSYIKEESKISSYRKSSSDTPKNYNDSDIEEYEIKEGEDLYDIAEKYDMQIDDLMELNKLTSFYVAKGDKIKVPRKDNKSPETTVNNNSYDDLSYDDNYGRDNSNNNKYDDYNYSGYSSGHNGSDNRPVPERRKKDDNYQQQPPQRTNNDSHSNYNGSYDNDDEYTYNYEEELRQQQEEARKRRQQEAAAKKKKEEAAAKKRQEEAAKKKRQEEAAAKKKKEEEAAAKKKKEEEAAAKKKKEEEERQRRESAKPIYHEVKEGQNLTKLAKQYGTTPEAIRKANNLQGDQIKVGQKLNIPKSGQNGNAKH